MYALLMTFKTAPDKRSEVEKLANQAFAQSKGMKGFKSEVYLFDTDNNEYGFVSIWETKEDIDVAYSIIAPKLFEVYKSLDIEPQIRHMYELYEPKPIIYQ